jgi:hypothetical protein
MHALDLPNANNNAFDIPFFVPSRGRAKASQATNAHMTAALRRWCNLAAATVSEKGPA